MDKRKLTASGNSEELRTMDGNMVATTDNLLVRWPLEEKQAMIRELAHRWNNHNDLLAALEAVWAAPGYLSKAIALGSVEPDGEKTGPYLNELTEQVFQAIANATSTH